MEFDARERILLQERGGVVLQVLCKLPFANVISQDCSVVVAMDHKKILFISK